MRLRSLLSARGILPEPIPERSRARSKRRLGLFLVFFAVTCLSGLGASIASAATKSATSMSVASTKKTEEAVIRVKFTAPPTYLARFENNKTRLIVDVMDANIRGLKETFTRRVGVVESVLTQGFDSGQSKITRFLISFNQPSRGSIVVQGHDLVMTLSPVLAAVRELPAPQPVKVDSKSSGTKLGVAQKEPVAKLVSHVQYEHGEAVERVVVRVSEYDSFSEKRSASGTASLIIRGAKLANDLPRALDVSAFGGGLQSIESSADEKEGVATIAVQLKKGLRSKVVADKGELVWSFFRPGKLHSSVMGVAADGGVARKSRTLHVEEPMAQSPGPIGSSTPLTGVQAAELPALVERESGQAVAAFAPKVVGGRRGFSGRRIDLDLKDADVHNVLRLLADVGKVNIVTADNVKGSVTIRMRNVPWDQALDVVLQSKGLGMVRGGNIIRVAPLGQLEKEREMAIARRRQELQLAPIETRLIPVSYAEAEQIQARAREVLSGRGSIAVDGRTNVLIARDVAGTLDQVEELVRSLDTQTPQVLVEARIVEATSRYLRDMGIQWGGDASFSSSTGNATGLAFPSAIGLSGGASDNDTPTAGLSPFQAQVQNPNFAINLPATVGSGAGGAIGLTLGSIDSNFNLSLRLSAAETTGMVRILSSPRILTLDNHEARISQGTLIPFSQVSAQGVQTTFQEAKLQLLVRPHVTADGSVAMHVKINRDEPDFNQTSARGDPTILKREAETDLLVMDGHTAVIGGIYTRNTGRNVDQVPFFGDIPLLGLLFQKRSSSDQRGELVIFITPRIVNRAQSLGR